MKQLLNIALLVLSTGLYSSCDKVDDPFEQFNDNTPPPAEVVQKVLLEDFTGFRCPNCPAAAAIANQLMGVYGSNLIVVSIHCTQQFAAPLPSATSPSDPFFNDYRTTAGEAYWPYFNVQGLPTGLVNRAKFDGVFTVAPQNWATAISEKLTETPKASIQFANRQYNESSRQVSFDLNIETLETLDEGQYFVTLYMVEDSIYDWQDNQGTYIENFLHRHVLRDNVNGTWGTLAFSNGASGQNYSQNFSYTLNTAWNENNCEVIAYLYKEESREIVQVEKIYVK